MFMRLDANAAEPKWMSDEEYNTWSGAIYRPPPSEPTAQKATLGVKFSRDIFISKSKCDQWQIPYKEEELEDTLIGKALRIKRDDN